MEIKQHLPHLMGLPPAVGVVVHTYSGLAFEPVALSVAVSMSLAGGVWAAWSHVFAPNAPALLRVLGLCGAIVLSGAEGYLMYQDKGDLPDAAYQSAMSNYTLQESRYQQEMAQWQANQSAVIASIKAQQQEIIDNDKLTSRRADMDNLTKQLSKETAKHAPIFALEKPTEKRVFNRAWAIITAACVGLTPLLYGMFHGFGWRTDPKKTVAEVTVVEVTETPVIEAIPAITEPRKPSMMDIITIEQLPTGASFDCPICTAASTKKQSRTVTCGEPACRTAVSRIRAQNPTVTQLRSKAA